jgi:uncharacterized protein YndB with AHSA1/START domain/DNA-binding transcriptional ArsR family regulator
MVKYSLNGLFGSLSDETRRDILKRLLSGEQTMSQLADAYEISLPAVSKHVKALQTAGMVIKEKRGRQWFVRLPSNAFKEAAEHLLHYEATLHNRLDSFAAYVQRAPETKQPKAVLASSAGEQQAIVITEVLNVGPEAAWHAYTDPASIKQWWSLVGTQVVKIENDVRVGGNWRFTVRGHDGHEYVLSGIYSVVEYPHRLEYTDGIGDASELRPEARVAITFERLPGGKTLLTKKSVASPAVHQLNAAWCRAIGGG